MKFRHLVLSGVRPVTTIKQSPFPALRAPNDAIIIPFTGHSIPVKVDIVVSAHGKEIYKGESAADAARKAGQHIEQSILGQLSDNADSGDSAGGQDSAAAELRRVTTALLERLRTMGIQYVMSGDKNTLAVAVDRTTLPFPDGSFSLCRNANGGAFLTSDRDYTDDLLLILELDVAGGTRRLEGVDPDSIVAAGETECPTTEKRIQVFVIRVPSGKGFLVKRAEGSLLEDVVKIDWDGLEVKVQQFSAPEWNVYTTHYQTRGESPGASNGDDSADSTPPPPAGSDHT